MRSALVPIWLLAYLRISILSQGSPCFGARAWATAGAGIDWVACAGSTWRSRSRSSRALSTRDEMRDEVVYLRLGGERGLGRWRGQFPRSTQAR